MLLFFCLIPFQVLTEKAKSVAGVQQWPYKAVAKALEVIPRTLIQNCGANTIRTLTALRVSNLVWLELTPLMTCLKSSFVNEFSIYYIS